jgi:hypothetical protein
MNKKLREISDGLIPLGIQPYIFPLRKTKIWKKKSKRKSSWTIDLDIQPPDSLAVETSTSPSYIT